MKRTGTKCFWHSMVKSSSKDKRTSNGRNSASMLSMLSSWKISGKMHFSRQRRTFQRSSEIFRRKISASKMKHRFKTKNQPILKTKTHRLSQKMNKSSKTYWLKVKLLRSRLKSSLRKTRKLSFSKPRLNCSRKAQDKLLLILKRKESY